jgi:hypothetical protein
MPAADLSGLRAECQALALYLTGVPPDDYVQGKYVQAHERNPQLAPTTSFDCLLLRWGTRGPLAARIVDAYASFFARRSAIRRKLVLLLAILESCGPERGFREEADGSGVLGVALYVLMRGVVFAVTLAIASIVLLPAQLLMGGVGVPAGRRGGQPH